MCTLLRHPLSEEAARPLPNVPRHVEHDHLLFLPPHSPKLQPAEYLWPLTNAPQHNRLFASIDELEDAQADCCVAFQTRPDLLRSATLFQ
jgi:hypothetical protein